MTARRTTGKRKPPGRQTSVRPPRRAASVSRETELLKSVESVFRQLLENTNVVFFSTDRDGRIIYVSPSIEQVTGYPPQELTGRHFSEFLHPLDRERIGRQFEKLARGIMEPDEYRLIARTGAPRWVLSSSRPIFDSAGAFLGIVGILTDIHRSRAAEEAVRETNEQFRTTFDLAAVGIAHVAPDGRWVLVNQTFADIVGFTREELLGMRFQDITHPEDLPDDLAQVRRVIRGEVENYTREKRYLRRDGHPVWVNLTISAVREPSGALRHLITVVEDISGRKRMEDALRLLRTAVESIPHGVTVTDLDGRIIYTNPAEASMHAYTTDELLGREARFLAPPARWSGTPIGEQVARGMVGDRPFLREGMNVRRDGTVFPVSTISVPVRDLRGTIMALVSVTEDISERRQMLEALTESEKKYRTLFETASDAIVIVDAENASIRDCNAQASELVGMSREALIGRDLAVLFPPEEADEYRQQFLQLQAGGQRGVFYNTVVQRRDGTRVWGDVSAVVAEIEGRRSVIGIFRDVTERRKAERVISQGKRDWEETFDTITDMITIHDEDFTIIKSNKAAAAILGLPWLEVGRAKCYEYFHGSDCAPLDCPSCKSLHSGRESVHEMFEPHLGRSLEIRAIPRLDADGRIAGLIHVVRDITERRKVEQERVMLEARLREAERLEVIGNLAGGVAHEVRNPLNAIVALTDALEREIGGNAGFRTYMQHMRAQVERLTTLMNDLLELGKPVETSKLKQESLADICALSLDAWRQTRLGREHEVVLERIPAGAEIKLLADAKKLQQVFINLLDNAAQHSGANGPIRIEIMPPRTGTVTVRVQDKGAGIPPEVLPRIFDTFFTTRRGGTGLGLSIVKHIVEKHGGAVTLENNDPPPGCTAVLHLPLFEERSV